MMIEGKISVIMAVYNTTFPIVKRAIDSVLAQDYANVELIVVDDGSDDRFTPDLKAYCELHKKSIQFLQQPNSGQSSAINKGIQNSSAEFISILDADDEYRPQHLSSCMKAMEEADLISSLTETIVDKEADYFVPDKFNQQKLIHVDDCVLFATLFGKKFVFDQLPFMSMYAADAEFYDRATLQFRVKKLPLRTYVYYRNNPSSICSTLKTLLHTTNNAAVSA
jgi:glycosyltransferase involved in cell wall biosynthesis